MVSKLQDLGRIDEAAFSPNRTPNINVDPISTGNEVVSRYGLYVKSWGDYIKVDPKIFQNLYGNTYDHVLHRLAPNHGAAYIPVDGLGLKYALADDTLSNVSNTDETGGLYSHAITRRTEGNNPISYTQRQEDRDTDGSRTEFEHTLGMITNNLTHTFDDIQNNGMLTAVEGALGLTPLATPAATPSITYPSYSSGEHYRRTSALSFLTDYGGVNQEDQSSKMKYFFLNIENVLQPFPDLSQSSIYYDSYNHGARSLVSGNFKILRTGATPQIVTDFLTNVRAESFPKQDIRFEIYKNATHKIRYDLTDCTIWMKKNHAALDDENIPVYDFNYVADSFTITPYDDLNTAGYWGVA